MRGAWAVESLTDAPDVLFASGAVLFAGDRDGTTTADSNLPELHVEDGRPMNREWLVRVREISDRDDADSWRGRYLLADAALLPPLDEGEVYVLDLIGMDVHVEGKGRVGSVVDVYDVPQGLVVEVETPRGRSLIPWHDDIVRQVDSESRIIVLTPLDGLLD